MPLVSRPRRRLSAATGSMLTLGAGALCIFLVGPAPSRAAAAACPDPTYGVAGGLCEQSFMDNGAFTAPAGVTTVDVLVVAGGGGGGGGAYDYAYVPNPQIFAAWSSSCEPPNGSPAFAGFGGGGGGGGGGGQVRSETAHVVAPGTQYGVTVGEGGQGGTQATGFAPSQPPYCGIGTTIGTAGGTGGTSSFGTITAAGGLGGSPGSISPDTSGGQGGPAGGGGHVGTAGNAKGAGGGGGGADGPATAPDAALGILDGRAGAGGPATTIWGYRVGQGGPGSGWLGSYSQECDSSKGWTTYCAWEPGPSNLGATGGYFNYGELMGDNTYRNTGFGGGGGVTNGSAGSSGMVIVRFSPPEGGGSPSGDGSATGTSSGGSAVTERPSGGGATTPLRITILAARPVAGQAVATQADVSAGGQIAVEGTRAGAVACSGSRIAVEAGPLTVACRMNASTTRLLRSTSLTLRVKATITTADGQRASTSRAVRVARRAQLVPVTG